LLRVTHTGAPWTDKRVLCATIIGNVSPGAISKVILEEICLMIVPPKKRFMARILDTASHCAKRSILTLM
jgi:hypothetical protein